jgi:hypothetical protein
MYGLGILPSGALVTQLVRRSQRVGKEAANLLLLISPSFDQHKAIELTGQRTGLFVGVLPDGLLLFTGHTVQGGEKLRKFQLAAQAVEVVD